VIREANAPDEGIKIMVPLEDVVERDQVVYVTEEVFEERGDDRII